MKNYIIYRNSDNKNSQAVNHVAVKTLIQTSFEVADAILGALKEKNPRDVFQLVSCQFKNGLPEYKLNKYVRRNGVIVTDKHGNPIGKVNHTSLIHNVETIKVV